MTLRRFRINFNLKAGRVQEESANAAKRAEAEAAPPAEEEAAARDGDRQQGQQRGAAAVTSLAQIEYFVICPSNRIIFHYIFLSSCSPIKNIISSLYLSLFSYD